jgi:hypothetical protein
MSVVSGGSDRVSLHRKAREDSAASSARSIQSDKEARQIERENNEAHAENRTPQTHVATLASSIDTQARGRVLKNHGGQKECIITHNREDGLVVYAHIVPRSSEPKIVSNSTTTLSPSQCLNCPQLDQLEYFWGLPRYSFNVNCSRNMTYST